MKTLAIEETISNGAGYCWWRDWEDKAEGGIAPAKTNAPALRYSYNNKLHDLFTDQQSGMAGGRVDWWVKEVSCFQQ